MYKIETFYPNTYESNSYLIINNNQVVMVDPSLYNNYNKTIKNFLSQNELVAIFITHGHYDHFVELENIVKDYPNVKIYMHSQAWKKINDPSLSFASELGYNKPTIIPNENVVFVDNQKEINIIDLTFKLHYLPGHTNCSICYQLDNNLFSGDVIFEDSIGRYDLPTGSYKAIIESIRTIKHFDGNMQIYPGHDEPFILNKIFNRNSYL